MKHNLKNNTAILVFANSSHIDERQKAFPKSKQLFQALTAKTISTVHKTHLPYFHFSESEQIGHSFGERFLNAIARVFEKGYSQVITIGNDTPQLSVEHLLETEKQLNANKFVLGPSTDGGFYLMGLNKSQFESSNFSKLAWQTSAVFNQLQKQLEQTEITVQCLAYLSDVDNAIDASCLLNSSTYLSPDIRHLLIQICSIAKYQIEDRSTSFYSFYFTNNLHNKGSPALLH